MRTLLRTTAVATTLAIGLCTPAVRAQNNAPKAPAAEKSRTWTVHADQIFTANGAAIEGGFISVVDGKIAAIGPIPSRDRDKEGVLRVAAITPGLIDLSPNIDLSQNSVEQSDEITPHLRVADALDPYSLSFDRALRSGVTTVLCSPPDENVIGGLSVVVKTGGPGSIAKRTVKADAVLRGSFGSQPSRRNSPAFGRSRDFYNRRPTTRMGVEWEWRKAFYDAVVARQDAEQSFPGVEQLHAVLDGKLPLMVQAGPTQDVRTAIFLKEEFAIPNLILDQASEAWKEPDLLVRSGAAVVLPPFTWNGRVGFDRGFHAWNTALLLEESGVVFAFSGRDATDRDERLSVQPGYAMRGGLSFESALRAVTITPARMLGIENRVGSLEVGKDADLVLWSGRPFDFTSDVVGVMLDGDLVVDPRAAQ